jgi:hypothetical protein
MTEFRAPKTETKAGKTSMSTDAVMEAKRMNGFLLSREHRGPGDTIEAAAFRLESRYGIPVATTLRLRNREVKDMFVSSFMPILNAYLAATKKIEAAADRMEQAYEEKRALAADQSLLRLADIVAGRETESGER